MTEERRAEPLTDAEEAMMREHHRVCSRPMAWHLDIHRLLATLDAERATPDPRVERLEAALDLATRALGSFMWLGNNLHNAGSDRFHEMYQAALGDAGEAYKARALLRSPQERSGGNPYETVSQERSGE